MILLISDLRKDTDATQKHLNELGIVADYVVHGPITDDGGDVLPAVKSVNLAHKRAVAIAKEMRQPWAVVLEDDVWFPAKDGWLRYLGQMMKAFPCDLYLGGVYGLNQLAKERLVDGLCEVNNFQGLHCYTIFSRFYDKFLSVPDDQHIDLVLAGLGVYKVIYPFVALQRAGISMNQRKWVDYNATLNAEDVYGGFKK